MRFLYSAPMRAAEGLHVEWVDDEAVVLDPQTSQLHYLNPTAALVYAAILELGYDRGLEEVKRRHRDADGMTAELASLVDDMVSKGLLIDE